jgi:hypothetical protein
MLNSKDKKRVFVKRNKELIELYSKIIQDEDVNYFQNYMTKLQASRPKDYNFSEIKFTDVNKNGRGKIKKYIIKEISLCKNKVLICEGQ